MVEINLKKPITKVEIDEMIYKIQSISTPSLLLIDYDNHNFESLETIKYCRQELNAIEHVLLQFTKMACLSVPPHISICKDMDKLQYFHSKNNAQAWLLSK